MFLKSISNNITDQKYIKVYENLLGILAAVLVFMEIGSIGILLFVMFNVFFYKRLKWGYKSFKFIAIIAIPFILNVLFIWNNDSLYEAIKHGEKYISLLVFPVLIIGQSVYISIDRVLKIYTAIFTIILILAFGIHVFLNLELMKMYLSGVMVWQMGYKFALSLDSHAPALNMHVAFLVVSNYYLMLSSIFKMKKKHYALAD